MQSDSMETVHSKPTAEAAILDELARASELAPKDLKQRVGKRVERLSDKQYKSGLDALVAARKIYGQFRIGTTGKPTKTVEKYAFGEPPPPPPPPRELAPAEVVKLLQAGPVLVTALKAQLKKTLPKLSAKDLTGVLAELIKKNEIHVRYKDGKAAVESYALGKAPPPPPAARELASHEVLTLLQAGPVLVTALKAQLQKTLPKLAGKDLNGVLAELIKKNEIHARYKRKKDGSAGTTVESYALGALPAAPPDEFIAPVIASWTKMRSAAAKAGVKEQDLVAALLAGLSREGVPFAQPLPNDSATDDRATVLRGLRGLVTREGSGSLIPIRQLRAAVSLTKPSFDAAVLALYADDTLILHHHDYVGNLSSAEREELVADRHGNYYIGAALRGEH